MRPKGVYWVLQNWKLFMNEVNYETGHADAVKSRGKDSAHAGQVSEYAHIFTTVCEQNKYTVGKVYIRVLKTCRF
jgi:hypothetical protein